jgi:integrase
MRKFLAIQPRQSDSLFARGSRPIKTFRDSWTQACQRAGVLNLLFHELRRTAVRNLRRAGVAETVIMKITGHRTRSVFERYNITDQSDTEEAGKMAEEFLTKQNQELSQSLSHATERSN